MSSDIVFVSVEASGDDLAADVIFELSALSPNASISAIGGPALERIGLHSPLDVSVLSVVGYTEALKVWSRAVKLADETVDFIISEGAKAAVLVDSWGFTIRVAERLAKRAPHVEVIKLLGPQVWATRAGRAKKLAKVADHLLCIFDFEPPFYEAYDIECTVIGNPAISRMERGDASAFKSAQNIPQDEDILLVLPGSRSSEVRRVAPILAEASRQIGARIDRPLHVFVLVSPNISDALYSAQLNWPDNVNFVEDTEQKRDLMAASTLALACSGTVTTELATQTTPMIVGYKLGALTYVLAKNFLYKPKHISLLNVTMDRAVFPELMQNDMTVEAFTEEGLQLLNSPEKRAAQKTGLTEGVQKMGWGARPAHTIAAEKISQILGDLG